MYFKNKNILLIFVWLLIGNSPIVSMEGTEEIISEELASGENNKGSLPNEIICYVLKEVIKLFIQDFNLDKDDIDPEKILPIKSLRLTCNRFKILIDDNKWMLLKLALKEQFAYAFSGLSKNMLTNQLSEILVGEYTPENEKKAAFLIMAGADFNIKIEWISDKENQLMQKDFILIMISISGNFKRLVSLMHGYGANINIVDIFHGTPLIAATQNNNPEIVEILLKKGAEINITHNELTALEIARNNGNKQIIDLIMPPWGFVEWFQYLMRCSNELVLDKKAFV